MSVNQLTGSALAQNQREIRVAFLGGYAGQFVSGVIWLIASAVGTFIDPVYGMLLLFFGCMGIFPLTQLFLRVIGRSAKVDSSNGLWYLGSQLAFTVPINMILVWVIIQYNHMLFFPATMIIVGAHYLPFITLYGMKMFGILAALLIFGGTGIIFMGLGSFSLGGWVTGILLILFAFIGKVIVEREEVSQI